MTRDFSFYLSTRARFLWILRHFNLGQDGFEIVESDLERLMDENAEADFS